LADWRSAWPKSAVIQTFPKSGEIQRYSEAAKSRLQQKLAEDPSFNPYREQG